MADVTIRIENIHQIRRAFSRAPRLMTQELNRAIKQTVFFLGAESSKRAPVDTGFLRRSHFLPGSIVLSNLKGIFRPTASYAFFVHQGTRYMRSRPFLLQAIKSSDSQIQGFFRTAVERTLKKIGDSV